MLGFGLGLNKWRRIGGGFVGLLDLFPNAAAAYSLRLLRKDYSGGLVRARAWDGSANQGEADVMAYRVSATEYVLDLNSTLENLDATAISRGLTTSDTLADLVSTGVNDYDGLTSAWYDQSLSNDATQSTAANQPKIVSAGSLVTENGKAAINGDGTDDILSLSTGLNLSSGYSIFQVVQVPSANTYGITISSSDTSNYSRIQIFNGLYRFSAAATDYNNFSTSGNKGAQYLWSSVIDGSGNLDTNRNGSAYGSTITSVTGTFELDIIGTNLGVNSFEYFQELIVFNSDQSTNRTGIETNINNFYSIYP